MLHLLEKQLDEEIEIKGNIYVSDNNMHLIHFYKTIQLSPDDFWKSMKKLIEDYEKSDNKENFYYNIRTKFNTSKELNIDIACNLLFLNKTCFRGIYRVNKSGQFNVPYGNYKNPTICSYEHVQYVSKLIQKVIFTHQDYTETLSSVLKKKDFVYLDPPYVPEKNDSFVSYTENGFTNHKEFFDICKKIKSRWCMSNSNVKLVTDEFKDYNIELVECKRAINSKKPNSVTNEVIIDNNL